MRQDDTQYLETSGEEVYWQDHLPKLLRSSWGSLRSQRCRHRLRAQSHMDEAKIDKTENTFMPSLMTLSPLPALISIWIFLGVHRFYLFQYSPFSSLNHEIILFFFFPLRNFGFEILLLFQRSSAMVPFQDKVFFFF